MCQVHIPKSGWALKKYATVKSWVNDVYYGTSTTWLATGVLGTANIIKDTAVPIHKYYATAEVKTCVYALEDSTGTAVADSTAFEIMILGTSADTDISDSATYADTASITTLIHGTCDSADTGGARRLLKDDELWSS